MNQQKIYNHYLDKRKEIMRSTQCKVEDILIVVVIKLTISHDISFLYQNIVNINKNIIFNFF